MKPIILLLASLALSAQTMPDPVIMKVTLPDKINWQKGASSDTALLQGDPAKPGIYIQLTRWHAGNTSRPHMHPNARYITVISGTWWLGWGPDYKPETMYPAKAGTYVVHEPNQLHYDGAKDEDCVIMIVGMGPANGPTGNKGK